MLFVNFISFLLHGADIITTSSYQASIEGFCQTLGVSLQEAHDLIGLSVTLATKAREWFLQKPEVSCSKHFQIKFDSISNLSTAQSNGKPRPLIAGSIGPYGAYLHDGSEYSGHYVDTMTIQVHQYFSYFWARIIIGNFS